MRLRNLWVWLWAAAAAAGAAADEDTAAAIARNRMGTLLVRTHPGAKVTVEQVRHEFWFGATLPGGVFNGRMRPEDAARWKEVFLSHFNAGVPEADFKWDVMEREKGRVNYAVVDAMLAWAESENIPLRGHCIYWGVPNHVQSWLKEMNDGDFRAAVMERGRDIGARYRGRFAEYDLNNEMMHADYYEQRFGVDFIREMALAVKEEDPGARLFVNDYDITTGRRLDDYVNHIRKLQEAGVPVAGIGVQGHLHGDSFDAAELRRSLDQVGRFGLPVRITEFNFPGQHSRFYEGDRKAVMTPEEEQAKAEALKEFFTICFAHPAVTGIMMWGFWEGADWIPQSALYRRDWTPLPAARAFEELVRGKWWTRWSGTADAAGRAETRVFYGTHRVTVDGKAVLVTVSKAEGAKVMRVD
ncbi:MAG: endo-1,4-beta-xylanase [Acidobacteriota bacterium]|nr:endo-1,4-beta-xylanase [Acidobacteriota bacterium]